MRLKVFRVNRTGNRAIFMRCFLKSHIRGNSPTRLAGVTKSMQTKRYDLYIVVYYSTEPPNLAVGYF